MNRYILTRQHLLFDLYLAFEDAARHKRKMSYVVKFEKNLKQNLEELCDDLITRKYKPQPSKCFRCRLSKEEGDICRDVPRQNSSSPLLQLHTSTLREHLYRGQLFVHTRTRNALRYKPFANTYPSGKSELAISMLCA